MALGDSWELELCDPGVNKEENGAYFCTQRRSMAFERGNFAGVVAYMPAGEWLENILLSLTFMYTVNIKNGLLAIIIIHLFLIYEKSNSTMWYKWPNIVFSKRIVR